jgi:hypothetical protein
MPKIHDQILGKYKPHFGGSIRIDEPKQKEKHFIPKDAIVPSPAAQFSPTSIIGVSESSKGGFAGLGLNDIDFSMPLGKRKQKPKKVRLIINEK